ncbi:uncharacterized protein Z518_06132 [Rhinocladiella mackenziei CBS 650.93]|uniref:Aminoglycoside phosphotransferase domain-containing protein n=1 Tax=Rhinocladiella mackenziei CBS 650.93 TaxID=1442369 RepID=A0A0D2J863_9EURO|nr:uncharacterized protein Z518_06132 [Rhinocladiella mackenziei CBS 650.93]KIX05260.1 hypothetical protein Z518_06132 [Rhinocladiella mackenziei CBS 650.93]
MTSEPGADGWFSGNHISLCHLDLAPRNILAGLMGDGQSPQITAIFGWDSTVFALSFMSCAPPLRVWAWNNEEDEDERTANDDPPPVESRQLKSYFEEAAGLDYV